MSTKYPSNPDPRQRIWIALDGLSSIDGVKQVVEKLAPHVGVFKIGLELMTRFGGPQVVDAVVGVGGKVFYDGKFADIPATVGAASLAVAELGVTYFNLHASCGSESIKAAVSARLLSKVLGVTVLTSIGSEECQNIFKTDPEDAVRKFAGLLTEMSADGIICSPQELKILRASSCFDQMMIVTPGVRPEWAEANDQKRFMTPGEAIRDGATALVIGRPIMKPPIGVGDSVTAAKRIADEIAAAMR